MQVWITSITVTSFHGKLHKALTGAYWGQVIEYSGLKKYQNNIFWLLTITVLQTRTKNDDKICKDTNNIDMLVWWISALVFRNAVFLSFRPFRCTADSAACWLVLVLAALAAWFWIFDYWGQKWRLASFSAAESYRFTAVTLHGAKWFFSFP